MVACCVLIIAIDPDQCYQLKVKGQTCLKDRYVNSFLLFRPSVFIFGTMIIYTVREFQRKFQVPAMNLESKSRTTVFKVCLTKFPFHFMMGGIII